MKSKFIYEWVMCTVKLSWVTAKCGNGAGTLMQDVETFEMQAVREASVCQPMKVSPYILLMRQRISAALHPLAKRNLITARFWHLAGASIILGVFTCSLCARNWQMPRDSFDVRTRDTAQHISAKLHLIFTVVLISRQIGPWKKIAYIQLYVPMNVLT